MLGHVCCWAVCATGLCVWLRLYAGENISLVGCGFDWLVGWPIIVTAASNTTYRSVPMELVTLSTRPSGLEDRVQTPAWA
ncbi:hypothetical protein PR001_g9746 [Phytophthora rubi]|uniref:Uncharacterized protein n=1 Tax=Phytophthora rubi TaxID=129364 RepID=A0A6A3MYG0_9STRA|nr:hypothetical protein PR001_g9746 [Phytophthora rubi]